MAEIIRPLSSYNNAMNTDDISDFASVYNQYRLAIYRYTLVRTGHVEDAQDITAQVFLKAYQKSDTYRGDSSIIYWLIGIARYQIADYHRHKVNEVSLETIQEIATSTPSIEDIVEKEIRVLWDFGW